MENMITAVHILLAISLIALVLLQDTKGGGLGAFAGGNSQSVFGATGAASLAQKATRWIAALFAVTSISLTYVSAQRHKSIMDASGMVPPTATAPATPAATDAATTTATPAAPAAATATETEKAPGTTATEKK